MKINLRESLNKIDLATDNKYDLLNTFDSKKLSDNSKKKLAEAIEKNSIDSINRVLHESEEKVFTVKVYQNYPFVAEVIDNSIIDKNGEGKVLKKFTNRDDLDAFANELISKGYINYQGYSKNKSLHESKEQLFKVVIQSGATKRNFESALYEDEAEEIVDYYGGRWIDENGFEWNMYVEEDDDSTEHTMVDNNYDMEDDDERAQREMDAYDQSDKDWEYVESLKDKDVLEYDDEISDELIDMFDIASPQDVADSFKKDVKSKNKIYKPTNNESLKESYEDFFEIETNLRSNSEIKMSSGSWKVDTIYLMYDSAIDDAPHLIGYAHDDNGNYDRDALTADEIVNCDLSDYMDGIDIVDVERMIEDNPKYFYTKFNDGPIKFDESAKRSSKSLKEASYGGAYDIEDDMYFTKEEIVEFADNICEDLAKEFGYKYDIADVYMDSPTKLHIELIDNHDVEVDINVRIDMRRIKKPSDLEKVYHNSTLESFKNRFLEEYQYYEFDESLNEAASGRTLRLLKDRIHEVIDFYKFMGYPFPNGYTWESWEDIEDGLNFGIDDYATIADYLLEILKEDIESIEAIKGLKEEDHDYDEFVELRDNLRRAFSKYSEEEGSGPINEDTVKQNGKWVNKGSEGTHGKFKTKKAADAQRKAMFSNGYKAESLSEKLIPAPQEVVDELLAILEKYDFVLDDLLKHPIGKTWSGNTHIQVINKNSSIEETDDPDIYSEQLMKYIPDSMENEIDKLSDRSGCRITYNFGANRNWQVTGGLDVWEKYVPGLQDESLKEQVSFPGYAVKYTSGYAGNGVNSSKTEWFRTKEERDRRAKELKDKNYTEIKTWKMDNFYHTPPKNESLKEDYDKLFGYSMLSSTLKDGGDTYALLRKTEDGKTKWAAAKYVNGIPDEDNIFEITYEQARGFEPLTDIGKISRKLGKALLPKKENLKEDLSDLDLILNTPADTKQFNEETFRALKNLVSEYKKDLDSLDQWALESEKEPFVKKWYKLADKCKEIAKNGIRGITGYGRTGDFIKLKVVDLARSVDNTFPWYTRNNLAKFNKLESLKEAVDDEINLDYETDFDDDGVEEGNIFVEGGVEYAWVQREAGPLYLDFDKWAVWSAREYVDPREFMTIHDDGKGYDFDGDAFKEKAMAAPIVYFVVEEDTGFIDWGPEDNEIVAKDFLNGKKEDWENDMDESLNEDKELKEYYSVNLHYEDIGDGREYDYEADYDDVLEYLMEICVDDNNAPEDTQEYMEWVVTNFDYLFKKYEDDLLKHFYEDASQEEYDERHSSYEPEYDSMD